MNYIKKNKTNLVIGSIILVIAIIIIIYILSKKRQKLDNDFQKFKEEIENFVIKTNKEINNFMIKPNKENDKLIENIQSNIIDKKELVSKYYHQIINIINLIIFHKIIKKDLKIEIIKNIKIMNQFYIKEIIETKQLNLSRYSNEYQEENVKINLKNNRLNRIKKEYLKIQILHDLLDKLILIENNIVKNNLN